MTAQLFEGTKQIHAVGPRKLSDRQVEQMVRFSFISKGLLAGAAAISLAFGLSAMTDNARGFSEAGDQTNVVLATQSDQGSTTHHAYVAQNGHMTRASLTSDDYISCDKSLSGPCEGRTVSYSEETGVLSVGTQDINTANTKPSSMGQSRVTAWREKQAERNLADKGLSLPRAP